MPLSLVRENLTYVDTLQTTHCLPAEDLEEEETEEEPVTEKNVEMCKVADRTRLLYQIGPESCGRTKVLISAGWCDQRALVRFKQFPEVMFVDTTHKTNNEGTATMPPR